MEKSSSTWALILGVTRCASGFMLSRSLDNLEDTVRNQRFIPSGYDFHQIVALDNERFVKMNGERFDVYHVDAKGQLERLSSTDTKYQALSPQPSRVPLGSEAAGRRPAVLQ